MKKTKLSEAEKTVRRKASREWKERNKGRRSKDGYGRTEMKDKLRPGRKPGEKQRIDALWEKLKIKHAGKPRLKKSIKPPIFLNFPEDRRRKISEGEDAA